MSIIAFIRSLDGRYVWLHTTFGWFTYDVNFASECGLDDLWEIL